MLSVCPFRVMDSAPFRKSQTVMLLSRPAEYTCMPLSMLTMAANQRGESTERQTTRLLYDKVAKRRDEVNRNANDQIDQMRCHLQSTPSVD